MKNLKTFENFNHNKRDAAKNISALAKELGIIVPIDCVEDFIKNISGSVLQKLAKTEELIETEGEVIIIEGLIDTLSQWWSELGNYQSNDMSSGLLTLGLTVAFLFTVSIGSNLIHVKTTTKKYIIKEAEKIVKSKGLYKKKMPDAVFKKVLLDIVKELKSDSTFIENIKKMA